MELLKKTDRLTLGVIVLWVLMNEAVTLKEKRGFVRQQRKENSETAHRIENASAAMEHITAAPERKGTDGILL